METLFERCQRIVQPVMQSRDWRILDEETFVRHVFAQVEESKEVSNKRITEVADRVYGKVWHDACIRPNALYERAYKEAVSYFYKLARKQRFVEDEAAEIAQLGGIRLIESFDSEKARCRTSESFLPFLYNIYRAARTEFLRDQGRLLGEPPDEEIEKPGQNMEEQVMDEEHRAALLLRLEEIYQERPRARDQLLAVYMKFLLRLSDMEIAERIGKTTKRVFELRSHGLDILENDAKIQEIFKDWKKA